MISFAQLCPSCSRILLVGQMGKMGIGNIHAHSRRSRYSQFEIVNKMNSVNGMNGYCCALVFEVFAVFEDVNKTNSANSYWSSKFKVKKFIVSFSSQINSLLLYFTCDRLFAYSVEYGFSFGLLLVDSLRYMCLSISIYE